MICVSSGNRRAPWCKKQFFYIKILFNQTMYMAKLFSRKNIEFYTYPNITIPVQIKYIMLCTSYNIIQDPG